MSEQAQAVSPDDLLSSDDSSVSMALPLLPKAEYTLACTKVELVSTAADENKKLIKIKLKTTEDCRSVAGEVIKAGFPVFDQISLTPTENYPKASIEKRLKSFRLACGAEGPSFYPLEKYEGKLLKAALSVQPARDGYDEKNGVARYVLPKGAK